MEHTQNVKSHFRVDLYYALSTSLISFIGIVQRINNTILHHHISVHPRCLDVSKFVSSPTRILPRGSPTISAHFIKVCFYWYSQIPDRCRYVTSYNTLPITLQREFYTKVAIIGYY
jgi:hypothetical protein